MCIELDVPRQRCLSCDLTFVYDYGLGLIRISTEVFQKGITERCHGWTISDVRREYELPYMTVELLKIGHDRKKRLSIKIGSPRL